MLTDFLWFFSGLLIEYPTPLPSIFIIISFLSATDEFMKRLRHFGMKLFPCAYYNRH